MRRRHRFRQEWRAERALWHAHVEEHMRRHVALHGHRHLPHLRGPWWLQARMRWRIFVGFGAALAIGMWLGHRFAADSARWWQIALIVLGLWTIAGAMAWRITRPAAWLTLRDACCVYQSPPASPPGRPMTEMADTWSSGTGPSLQVT